MPDHWILSKRGVVDDKNCVGFLDEAAGCVDKDEEKSGFVDREEAECFDEEQANERLGSDSATE